MKLFAKSVVLSLALLASAGEVNTMEPAPTVTEKVVEVAKETGAAAKGFSYGFGLGEKCGEFIGKIKAKLPSKPVMPTAEQVKTAIKNAPKDTVAFAKAHPYKFTAILAATAAVAYAVYKVCTAKKASKTKTVVVTTK